VHARRAILPIVLVVGWGILHCGGRTAPLVENPMPRADHLAVGDAPATIDELRTAIARVLEDERVPGAGIALVGRDGPIWVGGVGVRDRDTPAPVDADTVFRVGSLSKTVIALGVMRLVDQGKLDLDRPLREILPYAGIDNPWEDVAPVTLAQCLEHTAGFDDVRFNEIFTDDEALPVLDTLALNPRSRRVRWRPGTRHAYSNVGYTLAARAIEVASREPFDDYLRREILTPLGIADADFRRTELLGSRLATGHLDEDHAAPYRAFAHRPAGSLLASPADLGTLVHFWIRRGEGYPPIVSATGLARIERSGTLPYPKLDSDYGFANYGDVSQPAFGRGHDGGMPGFHSTIRYYPSLGVGYVMLLNSNYSWRGYRRLRALLFAYLTRDHTFPPPPAAARGEPPGAAYFAFASPSNEVFGFIDQATLGWRVVAGPDGVRLDELGGPSAYLVPTADGAYRFRDEYGSSLRFTTNGDGTPVMTTGFWYAEAESWWLARLRYTALSFAMMLLELAPLWAAIVLGLGALRRRRVVPHALVVWPALAALTCTAVPRCLEAAFFHGVIGRVHALTIAICGLTILFAVASTASLVTAIRWSVRPDRPRVLVRVVPTACAIAFFGLTLWLAAHGLIGFRTWAW
jgi:CubicO group peptidase (beta-lactamase class C family)